jgi:hypothetical protein
VTIIEVRSLVHNVVDRIDIYSGARRKKMFIVPDMGSFFMRRLPTMGSLQEPPAHPKMSKKGF